MKEPLKFRGLFLLSGLHFAFRQGGMGAYAATQYYHMAEAIKELNKILFAGNIEARRRAICMELIAILAIMEVSLHTSSRMVS